MSSLDAKPAAKSAPARKTSRTLLWSGLGAATIAVAAGLFTLAGHDSEDTTVALASAPATPAPATPAPAPAAPPVSAPVAAPVSDAAVVRDALEAAPAAPQPSVTEVLAAPGKPAAKKDQLTQALERPAKKKPAESKPENKPEHKAEHKSDVKAENKKAERKKTTADKPAKAAPNQADSDAALLAALMTHVRGKKATPAEQLKICKQYNAAGEAQCRERLCASVASKEPACKTAHKKPAEPQPAS